MSDDSVSLMLFGRP